MAATAEAAGAWQGRETRNGDNQGARDVMRLEPWCFFSFSLFTTTSTTTHYNHNDGKFPGGGFYFFKCFTFILTLTSLQPTPERPQRVETATQEQGLETSRLESYCFPLIYLIKKQKKKDKIY